MQTIDQITVTGRVVVGTDGSPASAAALEWAATWARTTDTALTVVRVVPEMPVPTRGSIFSAIRHGEHVEDFTARLTARAQHQLDEAVAEIEGVDVEGALVTGHPAEVLTELTRDARLTVLAANGARGIRERLLGGTVAAVLHHARGEVVVVPSTPTTGGDYVLVGLDDSGASDRTAPAAIAAARALDLPLVAMHVVEIDPQLAAVAVIESTEAMQDAGRDLIERLTADAAEQAVRVEAVVVEGFAASALADKAANAALLVVGSRGAGGFPGLLLGSVSRSLTQHPVCPTLVACTDRG